MQLERVRVGNPLGGDPQQCATGQGLTALLPVGGMVLVCTGGAHLLRLDRWQPDPSQPR